MIDLYKLHIFEVVVKTRLFSAAAGERLYVTQSAISQHIKDLETSLGQQLFIRGRRGFTLSTGGILAEYSQKISELLIQAENALTMSSSFIGEDSIVATSWRGSLSRPGWVQRFRAEYSQLTVVLQLALLHRLSPMCWLTVLTSVLSRANWTISTLGNWRLGFG